MGIRLSSNFCMVCLLYAFGTDPLPREQLLDRYHQHTLICKSCRTAHQHLTTLKAAATIVACVLSAAAVALLAAAAAPGQVVALVSVGAAVAAGVMAGASHLLQKMVFVDYDKHHASKKA
jgi:hypothetical protein